MDNQTEFFSSEEVESRIKPIIEKLEDILIRLVNETIEKSRNNLNPADLDRVWVDIELHHLKPIEKEEYYDENRALINIYDFSMNFYPKEIGKDAVIKCTSFYPYNKISCSIPEKKEHFDVPVNSCENIPYILVKLSDKLHPKKPERTANELAIYQRHIYYLTNARIEIYPSNSQYTFPILKIESLSPDEFERAVGILYGNGRSYISIRSAFKYTN